VEAATDRSPNEEGWRGTPVRDSPRRVDPDLAREVAVRFQAARNNETDQTVRAAYDQLAQQSDAIFARLTHPDHRFLRGLRIEFTRCESPYDSDDELVRSARTHRVLEITTSARERDRRHPLLDCDRGGTYDRFRAVHDIVGHVGPCLGFDRDGEFAAWLTQERLYDGLARWALATEVHAEHSVRWTTGTLSDHKATLIDRDLLSKVRSVSSTVAHQLSGDRDRRRSGDPTLFREIRTNVAMTTCTSKMVWPSEIRRVRCLRAPDNDVARSACRPWSSGERSAGSG
jgi:hypothetical protein